MQDSNLEVSRHLTASRLNAHSQTDWAIEDQAKTWTQQPVPMMNEHSVHLTSLPFGFRTWLWRYTCLLLLISMLWHRQAIFESKWDTLSSSAECRIRNWKSQDTYSPADWMPTHKPTELSRIKLKVANRLQMAPVTSVPEPYNQDWSSRRSVIGHNWFLNDQLWLSDYAVCLLYEQWQQCLKS